jgi:hypothetical protein
MSILRKPVLAAAICMFSLSGNAWAQATATETSADEPKVGQAGKDVIWMPTSQALIDRMLDMAKLTPDDRLVDLGSGDGRTVITAARRGAVAHGIEYNPELVALSKREAAAAGLADRATFEQADIFKSDFSRATVVTLFLLTELNLRLRPTLLDMKPGTRVVSNSFKMDDWQPDESAQVTEGCASFCVAYKWIVPAKVEGTWKMADKELVLSQKFQMIEGSLREGENSTPIKNGRLDGARITFSVGDESYAGEVNGKRMQGSINGKVGWAAIMSAAGS